MERNMGSRWPYVRTTTVEEFAALFWQRAEIGPGCWEWRGRRNWRGYGQITTRWFPTVQAHRIAYQLAVGPIPEGMLVCHHCDNRGCVNPAHLFVGTDRDNVRDMLDKGRSIRVGSRNPRAKLSEADITTARRLWGEGWTQFAIAAELGVSDSAIGQIIRGETWTHVEAA